MGTLSEKNLTLPRNWTVRNIREFAKVKGGKRLPLGTSLVSHQTAHPYIRIVDFKNGKIDKSNILYVPEEVFSKISRYIITAQDIYISIVGTVGLVGIVEPELDGANLTENAAKICEINKELVDKNYLAVFLKSPSGQSQIQSLTVGSTQSKLALFRIEEIEVPLPPLPEQRKIAAILGAWDKAIELTQRRIDAAQRRKKALLQLLFTGKHRLNEFKDSQWEQSSLNNFFKASSIKNSKNEDFTILSCSTVYGIIPQEKLFKKRIASKDLSNYKIVQRGDLVYDPMLLWDASIGFVETVNQGVISPAYSTFKFKEKSGIREYFKYLFQTHRMHELYKFISQGTNVRRKKAPVEAFLGIEIDIPTSKDEQRKIAAVLNAADCEIELLTRKLDALERQKKGLMQQLLTGQVRVRG